MEKQKNIKQSEDFTEVIKLVGGLANEFPTYNINEYYLGYAILLDATSFAYQILSESVYLQRIYDISNIFLDEIQRNSIKIINPKKKISFSKEYDYILEYAYDECVGLNDEKLTSEHILLSMLKCDFGIQKILNDNDIFYDKIKKKLLYNKSVNKKPLTREEILKELLLMGMRSENRVYANALTSEPQNNNKEKLRELFCDNLNILYTENKLDKVYRRDKEIDLIFQILLRRNRNNCIITGNSGSGLTSIVNGLVEKIMNGECPSSLVLKEILKVNVNAMLSGSPNRGMFEEKALGLIKEITKEKDKYILFFDDINNDINNENKEVLSFINSILLNDEIQVIATIPIDLYKKCIEQKRLDKRMTKVVLENLTVDESIDVINKNKHYYEKHHNIVIPSEIIEKCVKLCDKHINDKCLPGIALEIIDNVGSMKRTEELNNQTVKEYIKEANRNLSVINDNTKNEEYKTVDAAHYNLKQMVNKIKDERKKNKNPEPQIITENDILITISNITKIPVNTLTNDEFLFFKNLGNEIKKVIIGQDDAIDKLTKVILRKRLGVVVNEKRPIVFLFCGSTGVGKTFLGKMLAKILFGDEKKLLRIDCSEYAESHSISKLIGSAPSYVGYGNATVLERVKHTPYMVILLDEFEKSHVDMQNAWLQVFDDGVMTMGTGETINFSNTIIILTSNIGARKAEESMPIGFTMEDSLEEYKKHIIMKELKKRFTPEFRNRIDEIIIFNKLSDDSLKEIMRNNLLKICNNFHAKQSHHTLSFNEEDINKLYSQLTNDDKAMGGRGVIRLIESDIIHKIEVF